MNGERARLHAFFKTPGVVFKCDGIHPDEFSEDGKLVLAVALSEVLEDATSICRRYHQPKAWSQMFGAPGHGGRRRCMSSKPISSGVTCLLGRRLNAEARGHRQGDGEVLV